MGLGSARQLKLTGMAAGIDFCRHHPSRSRSREFRAQRIGSTDEVVKGLGIKVVGTVPLRPPWVRQNSFPDPASPREQLWQHQLMESVDATRVMLSHTARVEALRVLLVTSAVGGEGKTSLSSHMATSMARSGQKTLLIDCDLRPADGA